jgi:hypothetical protein
MVFDFINSIVPQSAFLVPFEQSVDEINALWTPVCRQVLVGDLGLMGQNLVSDLFS